ncbi:cache domain-containing protein [Pseudomonas sp. CBSPBW29]|uniref:cache domain-containing protein n=1 Tax=Pseudomonas TaxID=286 RepID=UPI0021AC3372|nr:MULTISPECIES: cache domain-containing protein [unclassified Pseudomonas]WEL44977.1 cache domain-containing protein [Pseudomonas sp. CBSPBW29]WEL66073.1 cache domain-containing protein [Pseudomonas sp. CBSPGW29]WEL69546.1 cache domain-containing protein [Pseudomonas sp. CBSPCGW29]WEL76530.1 cache domain-containing protein [Pseudomonas sp. CBSPAW29]WEL84878.1 cache domain-containing protein [Pseudomonas sp. CBSPCAW29]WEL87689.1 cache domain-containing protein [Pseudomonas sp. CBSPCBW29]
MKAMLRATWLLLLCVGQVHAATAEEADAQAAKALLEKALAYYQTKGDKAFAAFSRQGEFVDQDRYVFVVNTKGVLLASGGPSSALIGRDVSEVLGPDLNKSFKEALAVPEGSGIQQADYRWQNWNDGKVERKHVYYQRVGQRILAVGYYLPRATPEHARALRNKAVKALEKDPVGTLKAINAMQGGFLQDDLYVFVVDLDTQRYVAHGTTPRLVNTDFSKIKDPDGKPVGEPILAVMAEQDQGEYMYRWKNPVTGKVENKHAYLRKTGHFMVAVGYYSP